MLKNRVKKMLKDESGQGATEYILLLVVVVGLVLLFGPEIQTLVRETMASVGGAAGGFTDGFLNP